MMKRLPAILISMIVFMGLTVPVMADGRDDAISTLASEYMKIMGQDDAAKKNANDRAQNEVDALIESMEGEQMDAATAMDNIEGQVTAMAQNSSRKESAENALESADDAVEHFTEIDVLKHLEVVPVIAGALPYVKPGDGFRSAQDDASNAIARVRRILLDPERPGAVPAGDIVSDFIPGLIRLLFRFAWLAVFVAFTVSGVYFVTAHDNDERVTKAKAMITYTLIGFAAVALAFAMVKAVTDIDFFRFV